MPRSKKIYKAVAGAHLSDAAAQKYGSRLEEIQKEKGFITPKIVVADAKNTSSPLHEYFDWSNKVAAQKWRIEQAKMLLRSISVTVLHNDKAEDIRGFYNINPSIDMDTTESKIYLSLDEIRKDPNKIGQVVEYALNELAGWNQRFKIYSELKPLISYQVAFIKAHRKKGDKKRVKR